MQKQLYLRQRSLSQHNGSQQREARHSNVNIWKEESALTVAAGSLLPQKGLFKENLHGDTQRNVVRAAKLLAQLSCGKGAGRLASSKT